MTPERWQEVQRLFHAALELPPERRAAFLAEACAGDAELCAEVEALVAEDPEADGFFDALAGDAFGALGGADHHESGAASLEGRPVGPYTIVRQIGRGGMGTVYLARREDVGLSAALKLVTGALAAPERIERFLYERRLLARLEHPHIARLLDAGVTEDGTPWFAMEYVPGEPIDRFCDTRRLSVPERLALFERVCEAVAYAHRNLIVHRDLKPSNILVTEDGTPKLLDFGIAKLLDEREEGLTATGMRLLTPEYATPEQLTGAPVTLATDVYALGLVLYELLCGHRPYRFASRTPGEIERLVLSADPPHPSLAATRPEERRHTDGRTEIIPPEQVAAARATEPGQLRRRLSGDLDAIVMRALAKEPERRYPSVDALLDDLRRHRQGLPVRARPDSRGYRARKFVRRNRLPVATAALLVLLLAGFAGAMTVEQARTARERDRAEAALARAQTETEKAEEVTEFLAGLFTASNPYGASGKAAGSEVTARELLERGVARLDSLGAQPEVQAKMLDATGRAYAGLGRYEPALKLHERALAIRRQLHAGPHADVAASLHELGRMLGNTGALDSAAAVHRRALAMQRQLWGDLHEDVATSLVALGTLEIMGGDYAEAERLHHRALAVYRSLPSPDSAALASALNNLAVAATAQAHFTDAEAGFRGALAVYRALHGPEHPIVNQTLANLGGVLFEQGKLGEAEAALRQALAAERATLGREHPTTAAPLGYLGRVLIEQERYEEAESLFRQALAIKRASYGPRHSSVGSSLRQLGDVHARRGESRTADSLYGEALAIYREGLPADHPYVAEVLSARAALLIAQGQPAAAEPLARRARDILMRKRGEENPLTAYASRQLGEALTALGRYAEAEPLLLQAHEVFHSVRGADAQDAREARNALASLYEAWGRPAQAAQYRIPFANASSPVGRALR